MANLIGTIGVALLLAAFVLNLLKRVSAEGYIYTLLNLPGCRPVPVVRVSSSTGLGVEELWAAVDAYPGRPRAGAP